ncbi:hypothetical protein ACQ4LE_008123 [Meloidogyne hapla]
MTMNLTNVQRRSNRIYMEDDQFSLNGYADNLASEMKLIKKTSKWHNYLIGILFAIAVALIGSFLSSYFSSNSHIDGLRQDISIVRKEISDAKYELNNNINSVESKLTKEINSVKTELTKEMNNLRNELLDKERDRQLTSNLEKIVEEKIDSRNKLLISQIEELLKKKGE